MANNKTTEAQRQASKRWDEKNKEYKRIRDYRSKGLKFIREYSEMADLEDFEEAIKKRKKVFKNTWLLYTCRVYYKYKIRKQRRLKKWWT